LSACEKPFDRTPAGFKHACYGDDARRNMVCSERRWVATFSAEEADWPEIKAMVSKAGSDSSLDIFDVSSIHPGYVRTAELYACSAAGVMLSFDKRIYENAELNRDGNQVLIELRTYKNSYDWRPLAGRMESELKAKWPHAVEVETPPPLGNDRALPDSVESCAESMPNKSLERTHER
jgi:hypothetical protein